VQQVITSVSDFTDFGTRVVISDKFLACTSLENVNGVGQKSGAVYVYALNAATGQWDLDQVHIMNSFVGLRETSGDTVGGSPPHRCRMGLLQAS
jgi:hypothetical protein